MRTRDKRRIRESYDNLGGRLYDNRYRMEQTAKYDEIFRYMNHSINDIVLDDGCGTGLLLERLQSHAVGMDLSSDLLSMARSRLKNGRWTQLVQADADQLPFRNWVFDKVFAMTLIQNTPDPGKTLMELKRVARSDSAIVITALKKAFTLHGFKQLLNISKMTMRHIVADEELKDWIAILTPSSCKRL